MIAPRSDEAAATVALVRPMAARMARLSIESRIALLCALLTQELCNLPPGQRDDELERVLNDLPAIMRATERGMRNALIQNARDESHD